MDLTHGFLAQLFRMQEESSFVGWLSSRERFRFRSQYYARCLAEFLILDDGEFSKERLKKVIQELHATRFLMAEGGENDTPIFEHFLYALSSLEPVIPLLNRCKLPLCHRRAEQLIRQTLHYESDVKLEHRDVKRAVLSSYLCVLRQTIGSCFATAPAIYIQTHLPHFFFKDMEELLSTGRLRRVFEGVEYSVPMSMSFGLFGLKKPSYSKREVLLPLARALESVHLIDSSLPLEGKIEKTLQWITPFVKDQMLSPESLIRNVLYRSYHLTDSDFQAEERMKKMRMQAIPTGGNIPVSFSPKAKEIRQFEQSFPIACASFSAFFENPLLRTWEYTLASFSDLKTDFTRWHLYNSLGMDPKEPNGLGIFFYQWVNDQFQKCKQVADQTSEEYNQAYLRARSTEGLIYRTESEAQRGWLKIEFQGHLNEMHVLEEQRDAQVRKANEYSSFFSYLIDKYYEKFQEYFQEIYDPEMEIPSFLFRDSPAGFRLVYKHGRTDPNVWTWIYNENQFLDTLREFFIAVEPMVYSECPLEEARNDIGELTTQAVQWIQNPEFIAFSRKRASTLFQKRIESIVTEEEEAERTPWAYISGGTVETLLKVYFRREAEFTKQEIQVSSAEEFLPFFQKIQRPNPILSCSPSHAFLFHPSWFKKIKNPQLHMQTYGDHLAESLLDIPSQKMLMERFIQGLNPLHAHLFRKAFLIVDETSLVDFSARILNTLEKNIDRKDLPRDPYSRLSGLLYSNFPVIQREKWHQVTQQLVPDLMLSQDVRNQLEQFLEEMEVPDLISAKSMFDLIKSAMVHSFPAPFVSRDYDELLITSMRKHHLFSEPIFFADPNWTNAFLGFVVSPVSFQWEVWHLDRLGRNGFPMSRDWIQSQWILFTNPDEYS